MSDASRTYWVGLPVGVTVHDDGRVEYEIDRSEAASSIADEWSEASDDTNPDVAAIDEDRMLMDYAILASMDQDEMRCPVNYSCPFRSEDLGEMAGHIASGPHDA